MRISDWSSDVGSSDLGHNMDSCDLRSELTKTTDEIDEPPPRLSISAAIGVLDFKQCDIRIPGILLKDGPVSRSMLFADHSLNVGSPRFCSFNRCSYRENRAPDRRLLTVRCRDLLGFARCSSCFLLNR